MPPKGSTEVPGYGHVRPLKGIGPSGLFRIGRLLCDFGDEAGKALVEAAVDQMTLVRIRTFSGEPSATSVTLTIDTRGQSAPSNYARSVLDDVVAKLVATALESKPTARRDYKPVRTPAQRGGLTHSRR